MICESCTVSAVSRPSEHQNIRDLFVLADERSKSLYPDEDRSGPTLPALLMAGIRLYAVRDQGRIIGCGGHTIDRESIAELKRLFIVSDARGRGCGRTLVEAIERDAAAEGAHLIRLETGIKSAEAIRLYNRCGYKACRPFGPYADDVLSVFMEKAL